jgi:hypothetical protein
MSFPPEVFLIGAQRAGTTTLAYLLDQHPHIALAQPKEPHFFTHNWDRGFDWYEERFPNSSEAISIDASTSYSMAPVTRDRRRNRQKDKEYEGVPAKVFSANPGAKFIYLLRDPVERTYSGYWHNVRMGRENRDFRTALLNNPNYLDVSDYSGQLLLWLEYFPLRSFFFALFEDLKEAPEHVARDCFTFLKVNDESTPIHLDSAKNQGYRASWLGRRLNRLATVFPGLRTALKPVIPSNINSMLSSIKVGSKSIPPMNEEDRVVLVEHFRESNHNLRRLIGIPLDRWQH